MGTKIRFKNHSNLIPEGKYTATLSNAYTEMSYSENGFEKIILVFTILKPEEYKDERVYFQAANNPTIPSNRFRKLAQMMLPELPEEIVIEELIGKKYKITIEHVTVNDNIYKNITEARPLKKKV